MSEETAEQRLIVDAPTLVVDWDRGTDNRGIVCWRALREDISCLIAWNEVEDGFTWSVWTHDRVHKMKGTCVAHGDVHARLTESMPEVLQQTIIAAASRLAMAVATFTIGELEASIAKAPPEMKELLDLAAAAKAADEERPS